MDLEKIQSQLKSHIQQHQVLVQEMKKDPQNVEIQRKVHALQAELTSLNQKQRHVVQELKRNIRPKSERMHDKVFLDNVPSRALTTDYHEGTSRIKFTSEPISSYQIHNSIIRSTVNNAHSGALRLANPSSVNSSNIPRYTSSTNRTMNVNGSSGTVPPRFTTIVPQNTTVKQPEPVKPRPVFKKPVMITTGMQTVPSLKIDTTRLKPILPRPEADKPKVSLGIQTSKPIQVGKDDPEKLNFLSTLGLITVNKCKEITSQKQERKRRTSAIFSPYSSFQFFEPEPKKQATGMGIKRGRGRPPKNSDGSSKSPTSPNPATAPLNGFKLGNNEAFKNSNKTSPRLSPSPSPSPKDEEHEDYCVVCQQSGEVLMCDTCILVYHLKCLNPPLTKIPAGMWMCPKCQETCKNKEPIEWPGTLAIAHSYLKHTEVKDKEKKKLLDRKKELKLQEQELQRKVTELSSAIVSQIQRKKEIVESTKKTQTKLMQFKKFIETVQSW